MAAKKAPPSKATPPSSKKGAKEKKSGKDLKVRQLTEDELSNVSGGLRRTDQGDKSRQTVCR